ncbi:hypothetical protein [Alistipes sp.]|uniref:hypothetical protein n=1 Tax=Alistipes sp. TaxID=1872444 RepID=UPI0023F454B2|nr:hypothetical protein [Alistipes sp.]
MIANHQSFIDILVLLSICPKAVMVTNGWVWRSPVFGRIVRYLGSTTRRTDTNASPRHWRRKWPTGTA